MDLHATVTDDLRVMVDFDGLNEDERGELLSNIGEVVFESAVLRFCSDIEESEQSVFVSWVQAHSSSVDLLDRLCEKYPEFEKILEEEADAFKQEARRVLSNA